MNASIERLLLAMDPSPASESACIDAVELAAALQVELVGLFVEDTELIRSAQLPVTREIGGVTRRPRPLDANLLEAELRIHARRTRELLEMAASAMEVSTSFRVARTRAVTRRGRRARHGAVRALLDNPDTDARVLAAARALAARLGLPLDALSVNGDYEALDAQLRLAGGPIVIAAASPIAADNESLARIGCESGAVIALVE